MTTTFQQARSIVYQLQQAGHLAYFAGGWVRDYVMKHPSEDIDIATSASPAEIMGLFPQTILVGLAFGVVIVVYGGHQFEVATFRKDLHSIDGRHPIGIELSTPQEDAKRRDFTINGMFYDPITEAIHDYVQGQQDIRHQVIRAIGDPYERFSEDRLRMLRAFRFSARFSFAIDPLTLEAIREHAQQLFPSIAKERVWQEFTKMASYPRFDQALVEMHRTTLLDEIFPELNKMGIKDLRHLVSAYHYFPSQCPTILYIMELFPTLPLSQKIEIAKRLTASNKEIKWLELMDAFTQLFHQEQFHQQVDLQRWTHLLAHPNSDKCLQILEARLDPHDREIVHARFSQRLQQLNPHIQRIKTAKPLISAQILQEHGIQQGLKMGALLKEAEQLAITHDWHDPASILNQLRQTGSL